MAGAARPPPFPLSFGVLRAQESDKRSTQERKDGMNKRNSIVRIGTLMSLLAGCFAASATVNPTEVPDSEQVSKLLSEAKTMAFQLKVDAQTMESFTRSNTTWESHAVAINEIKERVNALGRQATKIREARNTAAPWQKAAIDRINPFLDELAGYTEAVIEKVNKHPKLLTTPEYKDYLEANADYAGDLASMIADFVDYGRTKDRLEHLSHKLEVPTR